MRRRITIQENFELIMECRNSGLTDYQWGKQRGLSPSTYNLGKFRWPRNKNEFKAIIWK